MLRAIHTNIVDQYPSGNPFTTQTTRSVTVFAVGSVHTVTDRSVQEELRVHAESLSPVSHARAEARFTALHPGEPFGVPIAGQPDHVVRIVDGPLDNEVVYGVRVVSTHRWATED